MNLADHLSQRNAAIGVFVVVLVASFLFFSLIAHYEPVSDDGWFQLYHLEKRAENRPDLSYLFSRMNRDYMRGNPRIGQAFASLNYWPYHLHEVLTPSMILTLYFCVFILALGRLPNPANFHDSFLFVVIMALCWLSIPEVGVAFFFRLVAGNYIFGACIQLLLFIPLRLWIEDPKDSSLRVLLALFMFTGGVLAGMANEHTGPMAIVAYAVIVVHTTRKPNRQLPLWAVTGWVGLVAGYLVLFTAPGQSERYKGLGTKTTLMENITARSWEGNLEIVGDFMGMLLPLLLAVTVMMSLYVIGVRRKIRSADISESRLWILGIGFLAISAFGIVATTLASPFVKPRLLIAPAILLIIAAIIVVDNVSQPKILMTLFLVGAAIINIVYMTRTYVVYSTVNGQFRERMEILRSAEPGSVVNVPLHSYTVRTRIYVGDDFEIERCRRWAAWRFGLERIDSYPRPIPSPDE